MLKQSKSHGYKPTPIVIFIMSLIFVSLACSLGSFDSAQTVRIKKILATLTPTAAALAQAAAPPVVAPAQQTVKQPAATPVISGQAASPRSGLATPTATRPAHLPTLTPTPLPTAVAQVPVQPVDAATTIPTDETVSNPALTPTAPAVSTPPSSTPNQNPPAAPAPPADNQPESPPAPDPIEAPTPRPETPGWSFVGIQTSISESNAYVVGELINNTGQPQQAVEVAGVFYNEKDQIIQDQIDSLSYVPVEVIPVGAHVPFELNIESDQPIYRLDLLAKSDPAGETPRQDFQFANVSQWEDTDGLYCLGGDVQNSGGSLQDYLVVVATAYNGQGRLVGFSEYAPTSSEIIESGQASPFEMCLDPLSQQVAHYELNALGY